MEPATPPLAPEQNERPTEDSRRTEKEHTPTAVHDPLFTTSAVLAGLVILAWAIVFILGVTREAQIKEADSTLQDLATKLNSDELQTTLAQYNALDGVATQMQKVRTKRFTFLPTWNRIKESVPKDVQFTNVNFGQDDVFRITGTTKSVKSVAYFAKELETKSGLTQVAPLSVDKQGGNNLFNFSISFKAAEGGTP
jgi:type IV pilus assembly PilN-like protein